MQLVSHIAFAAGIGGLAGAAPREIAVLAAGASLPDVIDGFLAGKSREIWRGIHRTVSHWPVLYPLLMAFLVFSSGAGIPEEVFRWAWIFLTGALIHITCDFLTPSGVPLYPPFNKRVSLNLIRTGSMLDYVFGFFPVVICGLGAVQQWF